jgi:predicted amidohydrolase
MTIVAAGQLSLAVGDTDGNLAAAADAVGQAAEAGAGLDGYPLAGPATAGQPALLAADCDLSRARDKRINENNDLLADRREDLYRPRL